MEVEKPMPNLENKFCRYCGKSLPESSENFMCDLCEDWGRKHREEQKDKFDISEELCWTRRTVTDGAV